MVGGGGARVVMHAVAGATAVDWGARTMQHCLPIAVGQRVLLVGPQRELTASLAAAGAVVVRPERPVVRTGSRLAVADASVDHVIVPALIGPRAGLSLSELSRVVRPGGHVFLGVPHRLRSPRDPAAWTARGGSAALSAAGLEVDAVYGIPYGLANPRHLVPLGQPEVLRWYLRAAYLPVSRRAAAASAVLGALAHLPAGGAIFPALGFVAHRAAADGRSR